MCHRNIGPVQVAAVYYYYYYFFLLKVQKCLNVKTNIYLLLFHDVFYVFMLIFQLETPEMPHYCQNNFLGQ